MITPTVCWVFFFFGQDQKWEKITVLYFCIWLIQAHQIFHFKILFQQVISAYPIGNIFWHANFVFVSFRIRLSLGVCSFYLLIRAKSTSSSWTWTTSYNRYRSLYGLINWLKGVKAKPLQTRPDLWLAHQQACCRNQTGQICWKLSLTSKTTVCSGCVECAPPQPGLIHVRYINLKSGSSQVRSCFLVFPKVMFSSFVNIIFAKLNTEIWAGFRKVQKQSDKQTDPQDRQSYLVEKNKDANMLAHLQPACVSWHLSS